VSYLHVEFLATTQAFFLLLDTGISWTFTKPSAKRRNRWREMDHKKWLLGLGYPRRLCLFSRAHCLGEAGLAFLLLFLISDLLFDHFCHFISFEDMAFFSFLSRLRFLVISRFSSFLSASFDDDEIIDERGIKESISCLFQIPFLWSRDILILSLASSGYVHDHTLVAITNDTIFKPSALHRVIQSKSLNIEDDLTILLAFWSRGSNSVKSAVQARSCRYT
jgi:hypothetical protein